ncbi:MAG: PD-(D/E)XK nuclease family protein [Pseudomonadota bacterium]
MRVFSVDPGDPFLKTVAVRLVDGTLWPGGVVPDDPLAISRATVYLPTRRAARTLAVAFLEAAGGPTALPRIKTLGESDDEEFGDAAPRPDAIGALEARAALAALVSAFGQQLEAGKGPDQKPFMSSAGPDAVRLADELMALMEQVETQEADWADLPGLVENADLARHWELTTQFLTIATEGWPQYLASMGKVSAAEARRRDAEAAAKGLSAAAGPMVVAGSTGSVPATRRLIRAIAEHPLGAIVLPGFDRAAGEDDWTGLANADDGLGHPQFGMKQLLDHLDLSPGAVAQLLPPHTATPRVMARRATLAAALRPAELTHRWLEDRANCDLRAALDGVALVEAEDERTEAMAVALAMREALEEGASVALVTPHRPLARRVRHALQRWDIVIDDSAGEPLVLTPAGVFARLTATVALKGTAAEWLALLKHPFTEGVDPVTIAAAETLFRGPRLAPDAVLDVFLASDGSLAGLGETLVAQWMPLRALWGQRESVGTFAQALAKSLAGVLETRSDRADVKTLRDALERLGTSHDYAVPAADWPATFEALVDGLVVRQGETDGGARILGPLEARLQAFDHVVLGGLNEGVWPTVPDGGPWMSRAMMAAFGLDLPERRIGLSAHDFLIAAHAPRLTLARAMRSGGEPTVASRWWQRLLAFTGDAGEPALARGRRLIALCAALDERPSAPRAVRPAPTPPLTARPTRFSVTEIGRLVRDPYAVYARRVLGLKPLDPLDADPDRGDRGQVIHKVLQRYLADGAYRADDAVGAFRRIAAAEMAKLKHFPDAQALWSARLHHIAEHVAAAESARIGLYSPVALEEEAAAEIAGVTLTGRIDRIDQASDGALEIIDYKSGTPPSASAVFSLLDPQLPLEAVLIGEGALDFDPDTPIASLIYVAVASGRVPVTWKRLEKADDTPAGVAERAREQFAALMAHYRDPATGYISRARVPFERDVDGDYDHLARTAEWQS